MKNASFAFYFLFFIKSDTFDLPTQLAKVNGRSGNGLMCHGTSLAKETTAYNHVMTWFSIDRNLVHLVLTAPHTSVGKLK